MANRLRLIAILLAVPIIGFGVATYFRASYDSQLQAAARRQLPNATPEQIARLTLTSVCKDNHDPRMSNVCATNAGLRYMQIGALAAGGGGLALVGLIMAAGYMARSSRDVLLRLFRPGLYVTAITITGLIIAHAVIAVVLLMHVHLGTSAIVAIGALSGIVAVARNAFSVVKKAETFAVGRSISRGEAPELWNTVDGVAQKLSSLRPDHIVVGLDPTFFVTEANVVTLNEKLEGRTLFCSLPLARILSTSEFADVIGHELAHFSGEDTKFSEHFYPIYRGTASSILSLRAAGGQGAGVLTLLPALAVFHFFLERFAIAVSEHSRTRELVADQASARVTDMTSIGSALVKVHAFGGVWGECQQAAVNALNQRLMLANASKSYADTVKLRATRGAFDGVADTHTSHPTDSHPPLSARLQAFNLTLDALTDRALDVAPADPAINLLSDPERLEQELSKAYQALLARRLGIDLESPAENPADPPELTA